MTNMDNRFSFHPTIKGLGNYKKKTKPRKILEFRVLETRNTIQGSWGSRRENALTFLNCGAKVRILRSIFFDATLRNSRQSFCLLGQRFYDDILDMSWVQHYNIRGRSGSLIPGLVLSPPSPSGLITLEVMPGILKIF